jgi:hypothetical protein
MPQASAKSAFSKGKIGSFLFGAFQELAERFNLFSAAMEPKKERDYTHLQLLEFESLPLDLRNRKNQQLMTLRLEHFDDRPDILFEAVMQCAKGVHAKGIMCVLTHENREEDYTAFQVDFAAIHNPKLLYYKFQEAGLSDARVTHPFFQNYMM